MPAENDKCFTNPARNFQAPFWFCYHVHKESLAEEFLSGGHCSVYGGPAGCVPEKRRDRAKLLSGVVLYPANLLIEKLNQFVVEQAFRRRQVVNVLSQKASGRDIAVITVTGDKIGAQQHAENHVRLNASNLNLAIVPEVDLSQVGFRIEKPHSGKLWRRSFVAFAVDSMTYLGIRSE